MARYFFSQMMCPHCKDWTLAINELNAKLPPEKQVKIVDVTNAVIMGCIDKPILEKVKVSGTPFLYLGEINKCMVGTSSRDYVFSFLFSYFKDEFKI